MVVAKIIKKEDPLLNPISLKKSPQNVVLGAIGPDVRA